QRRRRGGISHVSGPHEDAGTVTAPALYLFPWGRRIAVIFVSSFRPHFRLSRKRGTTIFWEKENVMSLKRGSQWSAALGLLVFALAVVAGPPLDVPKPDPDLGKLIVHEWGTFLSVQGSDGQTLGGMIESEERLPNFVRERALDGRN